MDDIYILAKELNELYEIAYNQIEPKVEKIIATKNSDMKLIEYYLDKLLDIPTDKSYLLLKILCNYCYTLDKEVAKFYITEFEELYDYKEPKTKKKT